MGFNALKYVDDLRNAGVPDKQAEAHIRLISDIMDSDLATKRDLEEVRADLKRDIMDVKRDIKEMETKLTRDIKELDLKIESVKTDIKRDIKEMEMRLTLKLAGVVMAGIGLLKALDKFF